MPTLFRFDVLALRNIGNRVTSSNPTHGLPQFALAHVHHQVDGREWPTVANETLGRILADMQPYRGCSVPVLVIVLTPATHHVAGDGQSQVTRNFADRNLPPDMLEIRYARARCRH